MKKAEIVIVPLPLMGHMVSAVEFAKLLVARDHRLFITVLIMKPIRDPNVINFIQSLPLTRSYNSENRIRFLELPEKETGRFSVTTMIESQRPHVKDIVSQLTTSSQSSLQDSPPVLAAFVFDMFSTGLKDVASDFGVPWYVYFTSGAAFLGCMLYLGTLADEEKVSLHEFKDSDAELSIPSLVKPLPAKLLPELVLDKDSLSMFLHHSVNLGEAKGILVNTFMELESHALDSLVRNENTYPVVYPVGPIINTRKNNNANDNEYEKVMRWLDNQAPSSVVFLCFGSEGSSDDAQVKEIASALEHCGHPFLWSLRQPPSKGTYDLTSNYEDLHDKFADGFLDRTADIGKVIGWAPQAEILAHTAVGGFVSHCGWNSILESIWFGVPIAAWPMYMEQQFNAFQVVMELGLGKEIKIDYRKEIKIDIIVTAREIEEGIRGVMECDSEVRRKVKEMAEKARKAGTSAGSSYSATGHAIRDIMNSMK